jgi:hypothetical protein
MSTSWFGADLAATPPLRGVVNDVLTVVKHQSEAYVDE